MLTELFEKYGNQKPMDLGTAVERTIPVSAVIKMMEEYHEGKVKNLDILHVSNSEVFEHYGKPFTSGRDLWDFLTAHYNFTSKT